MRTLIFAAGLGTRLKPLTDTMPKALVPVGGKPLLWHVVKKLESAGITDVVINVHHFADQIIDYVHGQDDFGIKVTFSDERDLLRETGGGIRHARKFLEGDSFLVHNVDILSDLAIDWFISQARPDAISNVLVSDRKTKRYLLFDDDMKYRKLAFSGVHLISDRIFTIFDDDGWGERFPIMDFYVQECASCPIYGVLPEQLRMIDVGKIDSLDEAESFLINLK